MSHVMNIQYMTQVQYLLSRLLITFTTSLDPDQARQTVGPDQDPNCLTLRWFSWKNFFKKLILKKSADDKKAWKITQGAKS